MGSNIYEIPGLSLDDLYQLDPIPNPQFQTQFQTQTQNQNQNQNQTNSFSNSPNFSLSPSNSPSNSNSSNSTNSNPNSNSNPTNSNSTSIQNSSNSNSNSNETSEDSLVFSDLLFTYIGQMVMEEERYDGSQLSERQLATERQLSAILTLPPVEPPFVQPPLPAQHETVQNFPLWPPDSNSNYYNNNNNNNNNDALYEITSNDHSLFYSDIDNNYGNYYDNGDLKGLEPYDVLDLAQIENSNQLLFADTDSLSPSITNSTISNTTSNGSRSEKQNISTPNVTTTGNNSNITNNINVSNNNNDSNQDVKVNFEMGLEESMFRKGIEEAQKFLPKSSNLIINLESDFNPSEPTIQNRVIKVKEEEITDQRGRKTRYEEDLDFELESGKRNNKQIAYTEESVRAMFDKVLLGGPESCMKDMMELRSSKEEETRKATLSQSSLPHPGRGRGRRKSSKEVVDLRTLLIHCAQAVAAGDSRSAGELLRQIRLSATPTGDATQRLAQCFADGLQARLAGTGSNLYQSLIAKRTSACELLKAYQLYMAACPFKKISFFFSNQTILDVAEGSDKLHIIDFGIHYGFQWPCLLQRLAGRDGGPPALKITGIDNPQPGFKPAERILDTGRRLTDYAEMFKVPFEFHAIANKWEDIKLSDIKLDPNEVTVVNSLFQLRNLPDETVTVDSPRDKVLKLIKDIKPNVFIHGIVNGSYNAPFFVTRFREALFHYSALFDMLEANVPRENEHRLLIERDLVGRGALNVIACEGIERVERPETYKQWQIRNLRAGFKQLGLNEKIVKMSQEKVKKCYHKDFVVDVDNGWLLQGWKGRILYGMSTWKVSE